MLSDSNIMVSILITFYNQEEYVDKCLESVIKQKTDYRYEILVGDDGSSDGTINKVYEWIEKYPDIIRCFIMERRADDSLSFSTFRASKNRINLLHNVRGKYFNYLDGDDFFNDDSKIQKQIDILEKPENADCVACGHQFYQDYPDDHKSIGFNRGLKEGKISSKEYWKRYYFHNSTLMTRSSIIDKLPLGLLDNFFSDWMTTFPVIQHGDIYYLSDPMMTQVITGKGNWTGQKEVVSYIRYLFMVDFTNQIGPSFKKESEYRLAEGYYKMLSLKKEIGNVDLSIFRQVAIDKGCREVLKWIDYPNINLFKKISMTIYAIYKSRRVIVEKLIYNVHGFLYRTYHEFIK